MVNTPIEKLVQKFGSIYEAAVVVGKRARQLSQTLSEEEKETKKEVTRAIEEAYEGKISA